jgi:hypothetical protein
VSENNSDDIVKSGFVSRIKNDTPNSKPIRPAIARSNPVRRIILCLFKGALPDIIDRKTILSIPSTTSRKTSVKRATHASGFKKILILH